MTGLENTDYWPYIIAAYAITAAAVLGIVAFTFARLKHWAAKAAPYIRETKTETEMGDV